MWSMFIRLCSTISFGKISFFKPFKRVQRLSEQSMRKSCKEKVPLAPLYYPDTLTNLDTCLTFFFIFRSPILRLLRITLLTITIITNQPQLASDARQFITVINSICAQSKLWPLNLKGRFLHLHNREMGAKNERLLKKKILILKQWPSTKLWSGSSEWDIGVQNVKSDFLARMR